MFKLKELYPFIVNFLQFLTTLRIKEKSVGKNWPLSSNRNFDSLDIIILIYNLDVLLENMIYLLLI